MAHYDSISVIFFYVSDTFWTSIFALMYFSIKPENFGHSHIDIWILRVKIHKKMILFLFLNLGGLNYPRFRDVSDTFCTHCMWVMGYLVIVVHCDMSICEVYSEKI